jgi:hypothetical protein
MQLGELPVRRYVLSPSEYADDSLLFPSGSKRGEVLALLLSNDFKKATAAATRYHATDPSDQEAIFCFALVHFFGDSFAACRRDLAALGDRNRACFLRLLMTDCEMELGSFETSSFMEAKENYQQVLDCDTNEYHKEIVKLRLRLIRYGY